MNWTFGIFLEVTTRWLPSFRLFLAFICIGPPDPQSCIHDDMDAVDAGKKLKGRGVHELNNKMHLSFDGHVWDPTL